MNLLSVENISKSYSERILIDSVSLTIGESDKIGLIGVNGSGKSTLLRILGGVEKPDQGNIIKSNGLSLGYLSQNPDFLEDSTVMQQIFNGSSPVIKLVRDYETVLLKLEKSPDDDMLRKKLIELSQKMDSLGGWEVESSAKIILTRLGITDFEAKVGSLSGGQKKRVAMAAALINPTELLILDEPTNHIDNQTVDWLEEYLSKRKGALLMVTHDRYFLDRVANRIIELDRGKLYSYSGNYSLFLEKKLEREENERAAERKRQNLLRSELEWIRRGAKARTTKQKARIDRFEKLQGEEAAPSASKLEMIAVSSRLGKKVIELSHITKGFGDQPLICDLSYLLLRDDRIGVIGPNGSGKSTLLKMIAGRLEPDSGHIDIGQTVKIAFFSQENEGMNENLRVIEYIRETAEYLQMDDGSISAAQMLERFLFPPSVQWNLIAKLSGGEKRRLFLLKCLMEAPNVLLLDEPTNDLDIQTLTILEDYLDEFPGAVIVVSHDRYFLDRVVERIFAFEGDGVIQKMNGGYSDYREFISKNLTVESKDKQASEKKNIRTETQKIQPLKLTFKEQREFEQIDGMIESLEDALKEIAVQINEKASDYVELQKLTSEQHRLEAQLEEAMERWVYLTELQQKIDEAKAFKNIN